VALANWLGHKVIRSAAAWHRSTFIIWTGWTVTMAVSWWSVSPFNHCHRLLLLLCEQVLC